MVYFIDRLRYRDITGECIIFTFIFIYFWLTAPEVINFEALTTKSDIWSVGVLTYVLLSGMSPFNFENSDDQDVRLNVTKCNYDFDDCFENIPEAAIEFIKSILVLLHRLVFSLKPKKKC